jgi:hypothetical protein
MTDLVKNIRSKLDGQELAYLKDTFGVELRDPETVAVLAELNAAARDIEKIEQKFRIRAVSGQPPHCAFCGLTANVAGPMAQATTRVLICKPCAIRCIAIIDEEAKHA